MADQVTLSQNPFITIAIPTRNRAALLRDCVAHALAQTYTNIEVLVSNNASTDNTSEVLRSFNDPRVRELVNPENIGLNGNWNKCIREARGRYIVILSDDNVLQPWFLEKCVGLLNQEPGLPLVIGAFDVVMTAQNRTVPAILPKSLETAIWDGASILVEHLRGHLSCGTLSAAIRTDILRCIGGFPANYIGGGEEEYVLGHVLLAGRAGFIKEACASHLFHTHPTPRHSTRVDLDARFIDLHAAMDAVFQTASRAIADADKRRKVQEASRTYVWRRAIEELALYRREGASYFDIARHLWRWRKPLAQGSAANFFTALRLRLLGQIFLPRPVIRFASTRRKSSVEESPATAKPSPSRLLFLHGRR